MAYAAGLAAVALMVFLLLRRRDSRVATIKSLPTYGTSEAAGLQQAIATHGAAQLLSTAGDTPPLIAVERAISVDEFREQMSAGGRRSNSPVVRWRHSRSKPVRPKQLRAPRVWPGFAPRRVLLVEANRCRICSRPLTNSESRRRGVGPDCYRKYGPRVVHIPNPAFTQWSERKALMDAQRAYWQALLDELYAQLMHRFEAEMSHWDEARRDAA